MNRTRNIVSFGLLLIAAVVGGCSKGEDATTVATTTSAPTAPAQSGVTQPASAIASSPATSSNVRPAAAVQPVVQADPIVIMHTSVGDVYVRLYEKQAPRTVSNFLGYVRSRFYDFTIFHQVEPGFVAMGGAFTEQKQPKSTRYPIPNEATNGLKNVRGSLAMSRDPKDPNSATSHFFFNLADNAKLDHRSMQPDEFGYCVFGQVIDGLDVLDKLASSNAAQPVVIHMMRVVIMPRDDQVKPASNQSSHNHSRSPGVILCGNCIACDDKLAVKEGGATEVRPSQNLPRIALRRLGIFFPRADG